MIVVRCAECGREMRPGNIARWSDQFQINIQPCTCIQNTFAESIRDMERALGESVWVLSDCELEAIASEEVQRIEVDDLKKDISDFGRELTYQQTRNKNLKRKNSRLKNQIKKKDLICLKQINDYKTAKNAWKKVNEKIQFKISRSRETQDRLKIGKDKAMLRVKELVVTCESLRAKIGGVPYKRSIEI